MNLRPALLLCALFPVATLSPTAFAAEGTLSGQIGVQVTISEGCTVGNNNSSGTVNEWGSINFGTYADLSNILTALYSVQMVPIPLLSPVPRGFRQRLNSMVA
ncbi:hypothetical protein [Rosenbergiella epipactidis]|uniref:hypothetical protein n=1 Tax=Rosenbergiella epipactidis TaxID=1544694 RepID=UPI001FD1385B|nr:hypothetical protein [Rosenbergiella epipactidis]